MLRRALIFSLVSSAVTVSAAAGDPFVLVEHGVESGAPVPGHEGLFVSPRAPIVGGDGELAFEAELVDEKGVAASSAVLRATPSSPIEVLAMEGDPAPVGRDTFESVSLLGIDAAGDVLLAGLEGLDGYYLHAGSSGPPELVAYTGGPVPGTGPTDVFDLIHPPQLGRDGTVVFEALVEVDGTVSTSDFGVWRRQPGGELEALFRPGDPAPGLPEQHLDFASRPVLDRSGNVAFMAPLWPSQAAGLFVADGAGGYAPAFPVDQLAPGVPDAFLCWAEPFGHESGVVGFLGTLCYVGGGQPGNMNGVWAGAVGEVELVARAGDAVAGLPAGYSFVNFGDGAVSASGAIAFEASATRKPGFKDAFGIWARDPDGSLRLVAFAGMKLPGRRGRIEYPRLLGMTARGEIYFESELTNGTHALHYTPAGGTGFLTLAAKGHKVRLASGRKLKVKDVTVWAPDGQLPREHVFDEHGRFAVRLDFGRRGSAVVLARLPLSL